ncbi:MAG: sulfite exporter TauE/SafE family protein [Micropruina sp.]
MSLAWAVPLGLLIGVVLGSLGGGGAILTVPLLVYAFQQPPAAATTGSLIIVGLSSLLGLVAHPVRGNVHYAEGFIFGLCAVPGAAIGSLASARLSGTMLMLLFAGLLVVVAVTLLRRARLDSRLETPAAPARPWPVQLGAALAVGALTGFFGVGGGFAVVPALVLVLGFTIRSAAATSLLVVAINSAAALTIRVAIDPMPVDWALIGTLGTCGAIGAVAGTRLASRLDQAQLSTAFAGLLVAVAAFLIIQNVSLHL